MMGEVKAQPRIPPGCRHRSSADAALAERMLLGSAAQRRAEAGLDAHRAAGPSPTCPQPPREAAGRTPATLSPAAREGARWTRVRAISAGRGRTEPIRAAPGWGAATGLSLTLCGLPRYRGAGIPAGSGAPGPRLPVQHP